MAGRITLDLSEDESEALDQAIREGRFSSVEEALRAGLRRVAPSTTERQDIAEAYRAAYERFPQDRDLGEAGAYLLAEALESEPREP